MYYEYEDRRDVSVMLGETITEIDSSEYEVTFTLASGKKYRMLHRQDCCEHVSLEEVVGDLSDLIGSPLLMSEEVSNADEPPLGESDESYTWTFYKFATVKGYVTLRWYGSPNGYYSESVDFYEIAA